MSFHIIGDQDTVLGYRFAGVTGRAVATSDEARLAFREALGDARHRILLLTERVEQMLVPEVTAHRLAAAPPYLVVIEDLWGADGRRRSLQELIFEAVGIRITRGE
jgi:vacuolar-type H+-ATPase subunit F/Vma7